MNTYLLSKIQLISELHPQSKYYLVYEVPISNNVWGNYVHANEYTSENYKSSLLIENQIFYSINNELPERIKNIKCVEKYGFLEPEYQDIGRLRYIDDINHFINNRIYIRDKFFNRDYKVIACFDNTYDYSKAKLIIDHTDSLVLE